MSNGDQPQTVAIATLVYSALTFVAMALYGVETWITRGEAFSVYFNLFSRLSPVETRDGVVGLRRPLSGLADLKAGAGTVPLLAVMIGSVTFDGVSEAPLWTGIAPDIARFWQDVGLSPQNALELTFLIGLIAAILLVYGFYRLGVLGAQSVGGGFTTQRLARAFVHTLVPIALAYVAAHYFTLLLFQGQAVGFLASDPLGDGSNLFGTSRQPDRLHARGGERHLVLAGGLHRHRARGRPDAGSRSRARAVRPGSAGGALAVLDARGDGGLHEPGPVAALAGQRLTRQYFPRISVFASRGGRS